MPRPSFAQRQLPLLSIVNPVNPPHSFLRIALLTACALLAACSETIDDTYKTRALAEHHGAITAGRVPAWLPNEAMQIREARATGSTAMMVRFTFPTEVKVSVPASCLPIAASAAPPPPFERAWWPKSMPEVQSPAPKHEYRQCANQYVAVQQSEGVRFVWSPAR